MSVDNLKKLEMNMAKFETNLENLTKDVGEIKISLKEFIEKADEKYSTKNVEKIVYGAVSLILVEFLGAIIYLVIK